jgi:UDP-N-acetylmuramoyl-L-alanyl-D-glutamate--2,6-diaminopimelate ligase
MTRYAIKAPINSITSDSRKVEKNSLFIAYPGANMDGREYIQDAIKKGASAVIWEEKGFAWNPNWDVKNVPVADLQFQAGHIASQFYQKPSEKLWMIGVTGTNGKTSVSHWIAQAMTYLHKQSAVIGTLGSGFIHALEPAQNTTPGPVDLQQMLNSFVSDGVEVVAMEASSHGLEQGRLNGVEFDLAVFTNLTQDHLDYHKTMQAYMQAKRRLFNWPTIKCSIVNVDDKNGKKMAAELKLAGSEVLTYGILAGDVRATDIGYKDTHFTAHIVSQLGEADVSINLIGEFNVYNAMAVLATLLASKIPFKNAIEALQQLSPVRGRMQMFGGGDLPLVVVDYAHTPDALEKVLKALKPQTKSKLVCVFGCGGNRDVSKRTMMGHMVSKFVNAAVVTNDNPRNEDPDKIIQAIVSGMSGNFLIEPDRAKAIAISILAAKAGDVVLVAGKGHEEYQEIEGIKHYFSDAEQVKLALEARREVAE